MVIVLVSFAVMTVLVSLYWICGDNNGFRKGLRKGYGYIITWNCIVLAGVLFLVGTSYFSYLGARTFYSATVEQYASAVEIYNDKAVIDIEAAAWTDLKYQGYQKNIADFIKDLRNSIISYNDTIISKQVMDANPLFNWLVIGPDDDMKIIKMMTASQHLK